MTRKFILAALAAFLLGSTASAGVVGDLAVGMCSAGGVTVTATTIDWQPDVAGGDGCINTGLGTNLFGTTVLGPGVDGVILDLVAGGGSVPDFMTFQVGATTISFTLDSFGPGAVNTVCPDSVSDGPLCSLIAGSPFVLSGNGNGTTIALAARGTVTDGNLPISVWSGSFSTQAPGETPFDIQSQFLTAKSITKSFSGDFNVSAVPEPASMALIGGSLIALGLFRRRLARR